MIDMQYFKRLLEPSKEYTIFTPLQDSGGFSVQCDYPDDVSFKPPVDKDGKPNTVALIHFVLLFGERQGDSIPILISARKYNRYLSNHFDYDFKDPLCPTESSVIKSKKTKQPIDLESTGDYFFNTAESKIYDRFNNEVNLQEVLADIFSDHIATVRRFRGNVLRGKFLLSRIVSWLIKLSINSLKYYLKLANGILFEPGDNLAGELSAYKRANMRTDKTDKFDFYGIRASKNSILLLAIIAVGTYLLNPTFFLKNRLAYGLREYELFYIALVIVALFFIDSVLPYIIFFIINFLILLKIKIMFLRFSTKLWPLPWVLKRINFRKIKRQIYSLTKFLHTKRKIIKIVIFGLWMLVLAALFYILFRQKL